MYIHMYISEFHCHARAPPTRVLEAEMWREMQYEEEKTTCKTLIAHLQKLMEGSTVTAECNGAVAGSGLKSDPQRSRSSPASTTAMPATASGACIAEC